MLPEKMKILRITLIILVLAPSVYCQQSHCRFSVPVNITDAKTLDPLDGFGTSSFQIQVGNQKLVPSAVIRRTTSRVFLFIDASGSMHAQGRWAVVLQTAYELFAKIDPKVPLTTEIFAEKSRLFTNRDEAYSFLRNLGENETKVRPLGGRTELFDDIASTIGLERIGIDDAVIVITDGADTWSKMNDSEFARELADHTIHPAFLLPSSNLVRGPETVEEQIALTRIPQMVEELGGFVFYLPRILSKKPEQILPLRFYAEALAYYRVTFETDFPEKSRLRLAILNPPPSKTRRVEIHAPKRLPTCSVQQ